VLTLEPIPKSKVGAGPLAHVIVSKPVDHLPLHRQESILARHGWDVRRSTLCDHLRKCGDLLTPLYELMRRRLLQSFALHADDTPLVLLRPRRTAFAWVYLGDAARPYSLLNRPPAHSRRLCYGTNPPLFPKWHEYLHTHPPWCGSPGGSTTRSFRSPVPNRTRWT